MICRMFFAGFILSVLMAIPAAAQAPPPSDVKDLVGARAAGGETQLTRRGYEFVKTQEGPEGRTFSQWWKQSTRTCINVVTRNDRFEVISKTPGYDCGRDGAGGGGVGGGGNRPVNVDDLIDARASSGESDLKSRGFAFVDSAKNRMAYTWWFNSRTSQCIMVVTNEGRYVDIIPNQNKRCR